MFYLLIAVFAQVDTVYNLKDFRIPDAGAMSLELNASLGANTWQSYDVFDTTLGSDSMMDDYRNVSSAGGAGFSWELKFWGERRYFSLHLVPHVNGGFRFTRQDGYEDTVPFSDTTTIINQRAQAVFSTSAGWYLGQSPFLLGFTTGMGVWEEYDLLPKVNALSCSVLANAVLEVGVGKMRNAAPAVKAWQFLEEKGFADKNKISALAGLLGKEWKYQLRHWRYPKFFYRDVEKLLNENGVSISAYDLMRLQEIGYSLNQVRLSGARVKLGVGGYANTTTLYPAARLNLEFGCPISRRWQLSGGGYVQAGINNMQDWWSSAQAQGSLEYYVGDIWSIGSAIKGYYKNDYVIVIGRRSNYYFDVTPARINVYLDDNVRASIYSFYELEGYVYPDGLRRRQIMGVSASLVWRLR